LNFATIMTGLFRRHSVRGRESNEARSSSERETEKRERRAATKTQYKSCRLLFPTVPTIYLVYCYTNNYFFI